jgi:arylsulfatase A-like enzyme
MKRRDFLMNTIIGAGAVTAASAFGKPAPTRPNILWIIVEDASPHIGCYGETAIQTPHLDALAAEGVRFENAMVTCPVCSPVRSALVTGMYQTTIGSHNHRSQNEGQKAGGNTAYYDSYRLPEGVPMVGDLFRAAGYFVCNGREPAMAKAGKTDYNFINTSPPYDGADWRKAPEGAPFFAQIQLHGGKRRKESLDTDTFEVPPYYPNDPVMRRDWSEYLASWAFVDTQVGEIIRDLKAAGVYDNTLIAFITDHGISHVRGKQFLYEEGIRVPMIVRFPDNRLANTVRTDLALHIDLPPISLACAGIPIPAHLQGSDVFSEQHEERAFVVSARDRCDETIDAIRCVRTPRYKYIRNFLSYRPHMQRSQYKDAKTITQHMRTLHAQEALTPLQNRIFHPTRPPEELYDLAADPFECSNLAGSPEHRTALLEQRERLYKWIEETRDPGVIPEPILEDLGKEHGSKYAAMQRPEMGALLKRVIETIAAGENNDRRRLHAALRDADPSVRYWAATWLGNLLAVESVAAVEALTKDLVPTVRLSAHLALCKLGMEDEHLPRLAALIDDPNQIVGLYAMNAIEQCGILNEVIKNAAEKALQSPYNGTQRYGKRLLAKCDAPGV